MTAYGWWCTYCRWFHDSVILRGWIRYCPDCDGELDWRKH